MYSRLSWGCFWELKFSKIEFWLYVVFDGKIKLIFSVDTCCAFTLKIASDEILSKTTRRTAKLLLSLLFIFC